MTPPGRDTRPTSDRVREAVFNALVSLDALDGAAVLDLFAGSGALGIEALSRGAASAVFVDDDRRAVESIRANLEATGLAGGTVVQRDVLAWLGAGPPPADLALLDPPYAFDGWDGVFALLAAPLVVAESDREIPLPPGWEVLRSRAYGGTVVTFARRRDPMPPSDER